MPNPPRRSKRKAPAPHQAVQGGAAATKRARKGDEGWVVTRCAAKSEEYRRATGRGNSDPRKPSHPIVFLSKKGATFREEGKQVERGLGRLLSWLGMSPPSLDYNYWRHHGAGEPPEERAVSVCTVDTYDILRRKLPGGGVRDGDIGENILIRGPPSLATRRGALRQGMVLRLGDTAVLEIKHINKPCYRLLSVPWSAEAQRRFDYEHTDDEGRALKQWFRHPALPLNRDTHPGGRGYLAKVLVEGHVREGDKVTVVP